MNGLDDFLSCNVQSVFLIECKYIYKFCKKTIYGSQSKKGKYLRFEMSHNALNRKPQK